MENTISIYDAFIFNNNNDISNNCSSQKCYICNSNKCKISHNIITQRISKNTLVTLKIVINLLSHFNRWSAIILKYDNFNYVCTINTKYRSDGELQLSSTIRHINEMDERSYENINIQFSTFNNNFKKIFNVTNINSINKKSHDQLVSENNSFIVLYPTDKELFSSDKPHKLYLFLNISF